MFTGIIEELGLVRAIKRGSVKQSITIGCEKVLEDVQMGDSIAVNGVCLTVVKFDRSCFVADVMNETMRRSALDKLANNSVVNLERAMAANGRFGGHIVSGHIDGTGIIKSIKRDGNAVWFEISTSSEILGGIVEKGSIAIDGISLTVAGLKNDSFSVSVIPHTLEVTDLGAKKVGDIVNLENDIIGKYVKRFIGTNGVDNGKSESTKGESLTREFLLQNGF